jgi:3-hydroxybutyrate dehydrogenase
MSEMANEANKDQMEWARLGTDKVSGAVAIVTGAARGMGKAITHALVSRGARVLAVDVREAELAQLRTDYDVEVIAESVATPDGCQRIVDAAHKRLGPISILINNAGIGDLEPCIWEQDLERWRRVFEVNSDGPFFLTRLACQDMIEAGWGRIVITTSTVGDCATHNLSAYTASKHAAQGLMRAVAQDVARYGVTCNAVMPGEVRTPMEEENYAIRAAELGVPQDELWEQMAESHLAGRLVTAQEVAAVVAFLVSEAASGINGEGIRVSLGTHV